jgi:hypothetical protein
VPEVFELVSNRLHRCFRGFNQQLPSRGGILVSIVADIEPQEVKSILEVDNLSLFL